jgi:hypothetical protein
MSDEHYWFPVRPARNGWGWGLPIAWQGWVVFAAFFVLLVGGEIAMAPYGQLATVAYGCGLGALFLAIVWWKGEPQRMREDTSP